MLQISEKSDRSTVCHLRRAAVDDEKAQVTWSVFISMAVKMMSCVFIFNLKFEIVQTVTFHFGYFNVYSIVSVFPSRLLVFYSYPLQTPQAFLHFFNMNLGFFWHSPAEDHCPQSSSRSSHTSTPSPYKSNRYFFMN